MAYNIMRDALEHTIKRRRKDKWMKAISGMAAVVVFCTTYALILPAITMEQEPVCGIEEHVHTDECYELPKELTCDSLESKVTVVHHHDEFCYNASGELICSLPEVETHTHTDACYETVVPQEPHVHTADCWETTQICDREEHTHTDDCLDEEGNVVCGKEEHTHGEGCFEKKAVCGMTEATAEELAAYAGGPVTKLICGRNEVIPHTHTDECYDDAGHIICGMKEVLVHQHTAECLTDTTDPTAEPVLVCTKTEHEHTDECFNTADVESPIDWEITLPEITDRFDYAANLVAVAESQLGYHESIDNTKVGADGTIYGYTRYGQWAETPYGDWSLHFLDFCLHYAKIPADAFPVHEGQSRWCDQLKEENWSIYWTPAQYAPPVPGDIVYLDLNLDGKLDAAAIVKEFTEAVEASEDQEAQKAVLTVIQGAVPGESSREVAVMKYDASDAVILGYACLDSAMTRYEIMNPAFGLEEEEEVEEAPAALYYCGQTEHTHGAACYDEENNLICQIPEHTHTEACAVPQPSYRCGLTEHEHDEYCRDNEGNLLCKLEEHKHTDACVVYYICGQTEHKHTDECYDENGELTCTVPEHTHDASCILLDQTVDAEIVTQFSLLNLFETDKPSVTVSGILPQGVTVTAEPVEVEGLAFAFDINIFDANGEKFEPLVPVEVTFVVPGITDDPDLALQVCHVPVVEDEEAEEPVYGEPEYADSTTAENGGLTATIPHFTVWGAVPMAADDIVPASIDYCCDIDNTWYVWREANGDNPFGSAQHFNVFVLGDFVGFNAVHGNAAIGGNIYGHDTSIGYPEDSNFNYQADSTAENDICLILGGTVYRDWNNPGGITPLTKPLEVANGTAVVRDELITRAEFEANGGNQPQVELNNSKRPWTHIHQVPEERWEEFNDFFGAAGMVTEGPLPEFGTEGSLLYHNWKISDYASKLSPDDPHMGRYALIGELDKTEHEMLDAVLGDGRAGAGDNDILFQGSDPFYNVFNVYADDITPDSMDRRIYLDIPVGSYAMVNVIGGSKEKESTTIDKFGIQFWYRDSEYKWKDQPAEIKAMHDENYNQSQMILLNFDPHITDVNFVQNSYLQASVLGPRVDMTAQDINLEGTIVFRSMTSTGNANIVYSPFYTGTSMDIRKETFCDTASADHSGVNEATGSDECLIHENGSTGSAWEDYYADVMLMVSDTPGGAGNPATIKELPLTGDAKHIAGISPGYYTVGDEVVYIKATNNYAQDLKERHLTVDEDGYWMVAIYVAPGYDDENNKYIEDPNGNEWILVYCDAQVSELENGEIVCSIPGSYDEWRIYGEPALSAEEKLELAKPGEHEDGKHQIYKADETQFALFRHYWNNALLRKGSGADSDTIVIQANSTIGEVTVSNHYGIEPTKNATVHKLWVEYKEFPILNQAGQPTGQTEWRPVAVTPPYGAEIQVTLYRSIPGGKPEKVPSRAPAGEDPGLTNPVILHGPDDWSYTWLDLPMEDENHNPYTYTVEETTGWPGWKPTITTNANGTVLVIENTEEKTTGVQVNKEWYDTNGIRLTDDQIKAKTELYSTVQLYRRRGTAPDLTNSSVQAEMNTITIYLNEVKDENYLGVASYLPGSDVEVGVHFYAKTGMAQVSDDAWLKQANLSGMTFALDGNTLMNTEVHASIGDPLPYDSVTQSYYSPILVTVKLENLEGNKTLVLRKMPGVEAPPIVREAFNAGAATVTAPQPLLEHTQYALRFVDWEDTMTPWRGYPISLRENGWTYNWDDLPLYQGGPGEPGVTEDKNIRYSYFVVEESRTEGYDPVYIYSTKPVQTHDGSHYESGPDNNGNRTPPDGILGTSSGSITIQNHPAKPTGGPELPAAGGMGTTPYTFGGLLAASAAFFLLQYNSKKRRKEDDPL